MAWPPIAPPNNRLNTTPTVDNHPSDHNLIADSISDIVNVIGQDPAGTWVDIQDRLDYLEFELRPPGEFMHYAGETQPPGRWLKCIGGEYPRAAPYDKLFAAIGVLWGAGNGTTTFNAPDLQSYVLVGQGVNITNKVGHRYGSTNNSVIAHTHPAGPHSHPVDIYTSTVNLDHQHVVQHQHPGTGFNNGSLGGVGFRGSPWDGAGGYDFAFNAPSPMHSGWYTSPPVGYSDRYKSDPSDRSLDHQHRVQGDTQASAGRTGSEGLADASNTNFQPSANCTIWIRY